VTILQAWVAGQTVIGQVDARTAVSSLWTPGSSAVNTRAGIRPGGSGDPGAVTAGGTPDNAVRVAPLQAVVPSTRADGSYIVTADASITLDILTANPADPANARRDLVIIQQNDNTFGVDANATTLIRVVTGTPSGSPADPTVTGSPDYMVLARITVPAAATTITNAMITDLRPGKQVALGGLLPIASATERNAMTAYIGQHIWRIDRSWAEVHIGAGAWRVQGIPVVATFAELATYITTPYPGQHAWVTGEQLLYRYNGSAWTAPGSFSSATVATSQATAVTSYTDLTTAGPAVTVVTGATALVTVGCRAGSSGANNAFMSFVISGASTLAADDARCFGVAGTNFISGCQQIPVTGLTPGSNTFTAKYRASGDTATFQNRTIVVRPAS
jgi:hypothetical protein